MARSSLALTIAAAAAVLLAATVLEPVAALDAAGWRSQQIYQVITDRFARPANATAACNVNDRKYCGGTHQALIEKLDYIQQLGFSAVWISPVVSNIGGTTAYGEAYHGYWTLDVAELNTHFGDADDLKALSAALHARGMKLMVDIVVNHVAATSAATFKTSADYGPFDEMGDFHPFCWVNPKSYEVATLNQTDIEECWLGDKSVALVDINTEDQTVVDYYSAWVKQFVADYSIDGLRIDTVKHVRKDFWPAFTEASGVYTIGEVLDGSVEYCAPYTDVMDSILNYPAYFQILDAFGSTNGSIPKLADVHDQLKLAVKDTSLLGGFTECHDQVRVPSFVDDATLVSNIIAYPFVSDGIPILYYGQEQGFSGGEDPANREPMWPSNYDTASDGYRFVQMLTAVRSAAGNASADFYTTQSSIAGQTAQDLVISKTPLVSVLTNRGSSGASGAVIIPSNASLPHSTAVVDVTTCTRWTTASDGGSTVTVAGGKPLFILPESALGSLCSGGVTDSTTNKGTTDAEAGVSGVGSSGGSGSGGGGGDSAASPRVSIERSAVRLFVGFALAALVGALV